MNCNSAHCFRSRIKAALFYLWACAPERKESGRYRQRKDTYTPNTGRVPPSFNQAVEKTATGRVLTGPRAEGGSMQRFPQSQRRDRERG